MIINSVKKTQIVIWGTAFLLGIGVMVLGWSQDWKRKEKEQIEREFLEVEALASIQPFEAVRLLQEIVSHTITLGDESSRGIAYFWLADLQKDINRFGQHYSAYSRYFQEKAFEVFRLENDTVWMARSGISLANLQALSLRGNSLGYEDSTYLLSNSLLDNMLPLINEIDSPNIQAELSALWCISKAVLLSNPENQRYDSLLMAVHTLNSIKLDSELLDPMLVGKILGTHGEILGILACHPMSSPLQRDSLYQLGAQKLAYARAAFGNEKDSLGVAGILHKAGELYCNWYGDTFEDSLFIISNFFLNQQLKEYKEYSAIGEGYLEKARLYHYRASDENNTELAVADSARYYYRLAVTQSIKEASPDLLAASVRNWKGICETSAQEIELEEISRHSFVEIARTVAEIEAASLIELHENQVKVERQLAEFQNRQITYAGLGIILIIGVVAFLLIQQLRIVHYRKNLEKSIRLSQVKMNPHFISNAFNALDGLVNSKSPDLRAISKYLVQLSRLADVIMLSSEKEVIPFLKEQEYLEIYIKIMQLRFSHRFQYSIDLSDVSEPESLLIPPMLLQPFIENAIIHGMQPLFADKTWTGELSLKFFNHEIDRETINCEIIDNGIGRARARELQKGQGPLRPDEKRTRATEIALERLMLLGLTRNEALFIEDLREPLGTKVTLRIPSYKRNHHPLT